MSVVFAGFVPHPPILVPEVGGNESEKVNTTAQALKKLGQELRAAKPDFIVFVSPHGPIHPDTFLVNCADHFVCNLKAFGDHKTSIELLGQPIFCSQLIEKANLNKIPLQHIEVNEIDHGITVPLYYLIEGIENIPAIIPISYSLNNLQTHFDFGRLIYDVCKGSDKRFALIASGDLSHRLTVDAPAGYSAKGQIFDDKLLELINKKDVSKIMSFDPELVDEAGECGYRSLIILLGFLDQTEYTPKVLSYEGPFGVGYAVINFTIDKI